MTDKIEHTNNTIERLLSSLIELDATDSKYDEDVKQLRDRFIDYYKENERHLYSDISRFLYEKLSADDEENSAYLYENISNVHTLLKIYDKEHNSEFAKNISKLDDHIKLEQLRFSELSEKEQKINNELSNKITTFRQDFSKLTSDFEDQKKNFEDQKNKLKDQKKNIDGLNSQIIAILGIFSAIIITFFGGINFLQGTLSAMNTANTYKLVLVVSLVGLVMFNIIFLLLNFIAKLTNKPIKAPCKCEHYDHENNKCTNSINYNNFIKKSWLDIKCFTHTSPSAFWINIILFIIFISSFITNIIIK